MMRSALRALSDRVKRLVWGVRLHEPGRGSCRDCMAYSPESGGLCTVVLVGAPPGVELSMKSPSRTPHRAELDESCSSDVEFAVIEDDMPVSSSATPRLGNGNYMLRVDASDTCHYAEHGITIEQIDLGSAARRARRSQTASIADTCATVKKSKTNDTRETHDESYDDVRSSGDGGNGVVAERLRGSQGVRRGDGRADEARGSDGA